LTVRAREADARTDVPAGGWEFVDSRSIRLLPAGTDFKPRQIYDLWYDATNPTVDGIGFAATRDLVSFLRYDHPAAVGEMSHTMGFGISLSGRFLRDYLDLGMNKDEQGRRVFDGVFPHISGAGKVFGNQAFAMPFRTATQHEDRFYPENWMPFGYGGASGSLLKGDASDPVVIETNTSTEYWQKGASLVHADPATGADETLPANVRMFMFAGTQHGGHAGANSAAKACANARNPHSPDAAFRALLVDLEQWVVDGTPPPASRVPRAADGTGVAAASVRFPAIAEIVWPPGDNPIGPPVDWVTPTATVYHPYKTLVSALDADGNEVAGLRLPDIAAPAATFTGTNVYKDYPSELCDRDGTYVPFAATKAEREAAGDPRPSMQERYGTREVYVAKVREAADALVAARLLLPEDAANYVAAARSSGAFP
ncbi:MAG: alpha/beta hydrolase domain-containing protein, partial [Acetobacteraceae bacterium]